MEVLLTGLASNPTDVLDPFTWSPSQFSVSLLIKYLCITEPNHFDHTRFLKNEFPYRPVREILMILRHIKSSLFGKKRERERKSFNLFL